MPDVLKQFAIGSSTLTDLGDVTVSTPALGHVLYYDGAGWVNATKATAGVSAVGHTHTMSTDMDDLTVASESGWVHYNDLSGQFTIQNAKVSNLTDVTLTALAANQILAWSGSAWVNTASPILTGLSVVNSSNFDLDFDGSGGASQVGFRLKTATREWRIVNNAGSDLAIIDITAGNVTVFQMQDGSAANAVHIRTTGVEINRGRNGVDFTVDGNGVTDLIFADVSADEVIFAGGVKVDSNGDLVAQSYTDGTRPSPGSPGRVIWNTDDGKPNWDNGTNWVLSDGTTT